MGNSKYIVYLHINKVNNYVYVGITKHTTNPNNRWKNGKGYTKSTKFYNAILKYRWDSFSHIVFCNTSQDKAELLEQALIAYYKRRGKSYNITDGGEHNIPSMLGKHHTEETKKKIGQAGQRPCSQETRLKISIANSGTNNGMYGKSLSDKQIQAIKKALSKPVLQFSMQGELLREFASITDAERYINKKGKHISCCCRGRRKTAYGYIWRYK